MNPKEKALELKQKFGIATMFSKDNNGYTLSEEMATKMAIIAVDEIIEALNAFGYIGAMYDDFETGYKVSTTDKDPTEFWQQVKNELTK